ncbi:mitochondrial nicotinamide adenine dinucleotide transporter 2 [[Candida] railenensis]|uniref:Mitochondrial thiamine pyrophosphate carrier 1 n=1 Tax=[Candida] railenensis TaxID=45579 RepID=A0A9P0QP73_9ASCO|nr:mitochondrial nicotinamide adenine dinucleotide transporter 2 [[Candida] railenensis]
MAPSKNDVDFSDRIQGEDLEFNRNTMEDFHVRHKFKSIGAANNAIIQNSFVHKVLSNCSATQLVTLSGAASGFLAGVVVCPLDVVKTRLQAKGKKSTRGFVGEFTHIVHKEGLRGLYRGLVPITIGYLPTWTIYFTIYERAKKFYPGFMEEKFGLEMDSVNHFCAALTAGMVSSIAVNPIWVVKTRLMIQTSNKKGTETSHYKGTIDAFKTMYKEEGIRVFYSGLIPSLFGLLHVGIHFPVYEKLKEVTGCTRPALPLSATSHESDEIDFNHGPNHLLLRLIFASSLAKMIASTITYPHEILRTRMQLRSSKEPYGTVHEGQDKGKLLKTLFKIYQKEGLKGFYAGYVVNLARTVPASAVTLVSFEYFKTYLLEVSGNKLA